MVKTMASSFPSCFYLIYFFINSLRCPVDSLIGEFRPGMPDKAMLARLYRCSVVDRPRGSFCNARSCWLRANGPRRQASEEVADGICIGVGEADSDSVSQILGFHPRSDSCEFSQVAPGVGVRKLGGPRRYAISQNDGGAFQTFAHGIRVCAHQASRSQEGSAEVPRDHGDDVNQSCSRQNVEHRTACGAGRLTVIRRMRYWLGFANRDDKGGAMMTCIGHDGFAFVHDGARLLRRGNPRDQADEARFLHVDLVKEARCGLQKEFIHPAILRYLPR